MQRETPHIEKVVREYNISILSLYAEGDRIAVIYVVKGYRFQSSPSMQRETR